MIPICLPANDNSLVGEVGLLSLYCLPFHTLHFWSGGYSHRLGQIVGVRTNISRTSRGSTAHHIKQQMYADV